MTEPLRESVSVPVPVLSRCRWLLNEAAHALAHDRLTSGDRAVLAESLFDRATDLRHYTGEGTTVD